MTDVNREIEKCRRELLQVVAVTGQQQAAIDQLKDDVTAFMERLERTAREIADLRRERERA